MSQSARRTRAMRVAPVVMILALIVALIPFQSAVAAGLDGVYHNPYGSDELYASQPTERTPRDPMAGDNVVIHATTWPVASGQTVWVTWSKNGVNQRPIGGSFENNAGNNSYWAVNLGSFTRGDQISYTVNADVNGGGQKSTGPFSFSTTSWSTVTNVTTYRDNGTSVDVTTGDSAGSFIPKIRFAFPRTDGFTMQIAPYGSGLTQTGLANYTVTNSSGTLQITTSELVLKIQKSPFRVAVYKGDGTTLITREYDPATFRNIGWASDGSTTVTKIEDHYLTGSGERYEGYGERYDTLDHSGTDVHNYVYNQYRNQGATHRTYLSAPFFINTAGYGIHVVSTRYSIFNVGTYLSNLAGFTTDTGGALNSTLTYEVYTGTQSDILNDYTSVTGRPQLPPKWAFGLWMSANEWNTQAKVNTELAKVASSGIPHTVMVLEQWSDEATFYLWKGATYTPTTDSTPLDYSDLTFPTGGPWTDPKSMVDAAHAQGIHMVLWQVPVLKENFSTNPSSAPQQHLNDKAYAAAHGYLVGDGTGSAYRIPSSQWFGDSTMPDFTNAAASSWWMGKRAYLFDDVGIDGMKTDGSEMIFGRHATFSDGRKGDEMHNAYPNAYTKAYSDFVQTETGHNGVLLSRAGTSGAQSNSIFWAGDQSSTFTSFQDAVRAGQSAGESGVPFWTWDMAGFTGSFPSSELYLRSAAQETFSPMMQYHSEKADPSPSEERTPWNVQARTGDMTVMPTFTKFANVRMNLIPYLYTSAEESASTGVPMMRAMSLSFPGDTTAAGYDQQYMLGSQLLVAPLTTQGQTVKSLYLPAGEWYDFWNGGRAIGGAVKNYYADTSTIPVYAKAGAVIPLNLNANYEVGGTISNDVDNYANLAFRIYPAASSSYNYYEDSANAHRTIGVTSNRAAGTVTVNFPPLTTKSTLQVSSTKPSGVTVGGATLTQQATVAGLRSAATGWYWDQVQQLAYVKVASSTTARNIVLSGVDKAAYEAEFGTQFGISTNTNHPGYTGVGFIDGFDALNDALQVDVQADVTANTKIQLRYANATGSTATRTIKVDGSTVGTVSLPSLANWDSWGTASLAVTLTAEKHTIRIEYASGNSGAINLDNIVLSRR